MYYSKMFFLGIYVLTAIVQPEIGSAESYQDVYGINSQQEKSEQIEVVFRAEELINMKVYDIEGHELGSIKDLLIRGNQISYVIIARLDQFITLVPFLSLQINAVDNRIMLNVTKVQFEDSPSFSSFSDLETKVEVLLMEIRGYYGSDVRGYKNLQTRPLTSRPPQKYPTVETICDVKTQIESVIIISSEKMYEEYLNRDDVQIGPCNP